MTRDSCQWPVVSCQKKEPQILRLASLAQDDKLIKAPAHHAGLFVVVGCQLSEEQAPRGFVGSKGILRLAPFAQDDTRVGLSRVRARDCRGGCRGLPPPSEAIPAHRSGAAVANELLNEFLLQRVILARRQTWYGLVSVL